MQNSNLTLILSAQKLAVCKFDKNDPVPVWAENNFFFSITRTEDELSLVCPEDILPDNITAEKDWRALKVNGTLAFSLTGILSSIIVPLAEAEIGIFALSTFNTDYVLIKECNLVKALSILSKHYKIITELP